MASILLSKWGCSLVAAGKAMKEISTPLPVPHRRQRGSNSSLFIHTKVIPNLNL